MVQLLSLLEIDSVTQVKILVMAVCILFFIDIPLSLLLPTMGKIVGQTALSKLVEK